MTEPKDPEKVPVESTRPVNETPEPISADPPRTAFERLGLYNLCVLILGTIFIIVPMAFLAYMWGISIRALKGESTTALWVDIARSVWAARVVTLATVMIRLATAAQLCVFAAMMAALILERAGVTSTDLPLLSMIRCANTGPQALIWHIWHTIRMRNIGRRQFGYSFLVVIAILNALVLQLTSTILLVDFADIGVVLGTTTADVPWATTNEEFAIEVQEATDFWHYAQLTMPPFAEQRGSPNNGSNFSDTGKVYRGLLPFVNTTTRSSLRTYKGPMTVIDERIVCVKPEKMSNIVLHGPTANGSYYSVGSTLTFNNSHPDVLQLQPNVAFNCSLPFFDAGSVKNHTWPTSMCAVGPDFAVLAHGIQEVEGASDTSDDSSDSVMGDTQTWVFMNVTEEFDNWEAKIGAKTDGGPRLVLPLSQINSANGPWQSYGPTNFSIEASGVGLSVCFINLNPHVYDVDASTSSTLGTGDIEIKYNPDDFKLNTSEVDAVLGFGADYYATGTRNTYLNNQNSRGLLHLNKISLWNAQQSGDRPNANAWLVRCLQSMSGNDLGLLDDTVLNSTFAFTREASTYAETMDYTLQAVGQTVLHTTNDPALTLQTIAHMISQSAYTKFFYSFDLNGTSQYELLQNRYLPIQWHAYIGVACILVFHLFLFMIAMFLFVTRTEGSLLGNAWQAIAQVHSMDTAEAIHHGHRSTDKEIKSNAWNNHRSGGTAIYIKKSIRGRLEAHHSA